MDASAFIDKLVSLPSYEGQSVHVEHIRPRKASFAATPQGLSAALRERLSASGIKSLYSHQADAVGLALEGRNVMVATPSASGKTLCYNLPVLDTMVREKNGRALYLFPTKALAQDQRRALAALGGELLEETDCALFDGDTPRADRAEIKRRARIVLTNPDMLHLGILPNHQSWARLFRNLRYVVLDEAHTYRGVFGSHVANVLKRLRRLCSFYGSQPVFIACSASIANPKAHAESLAGLPFSVVDVDGSPYGSKYFVFWNPPLIGDARDSRRSANSEATWLLTLLLREGVRTLGFTRTRRVTELIYRYVRQQLAGTDLADKFKPYRAGYTPESRREVERALFSGALLGVVATNALELGIDVGGLDATVLTGYPGSIASTWQQAGRSGRRSGDSLSFLIGLNNPLDQYFMRHPENFFAKPFERALINPENPFVLSLHLLCAAWERPLGGDDGEIFGGPYKELVDTLIDNGCIVPREASTRDEPEKRWYVSPGIAYPAQDINIRAAGQQRFDVVDASRSNSLLETVEMSRVFYQLHQGAVYLHQGDSYLVTELDLQSHVARVTPTDADYYTQAKELTELRVKRTISQRHRGRVWTYFGEVEVTAEVVGYKRKRQYTEEVLGEELLELPPQNFSTQALWFSLPEGLEERLGKAGLDLAGGLHAAEHVSIAMLPLFALCDRDDIGGVSTPYHPDTGQAGVFIYDAYPGGVGIAKLGFENVTELWRAALRAVSECPCQEGCPSCVHSPKCGNNNEPLDKKAAEVLLRSLLTGT